MIVASRIEHSAIREVAERHEDAGGDVIWLDSDAHGVVRPDMLEDALATRAADIAIVSVMWANNETGVIQPIETLGELCRTHGVRFHTDAVQWVGKMPTNVSELPIDLLSFSGHKFHGPKGAGGLYIRRGIRLGKRSIGGPQERERRGGTENVPGILGLAAAAECALQWLATEERDRLSTLRSRFESVIVERVDGAVVNNIDAPRMWNTANIGFRRLEAEAILLSLSERGVCASAGAACSSGSLEPSPVLLAMGISPDVAHGSVRFSLSRDTTEEEIDRAIEIVVESVERLRARLSAV